MKTSLKIKELVTVYCHRKLGTPTKPRCGESSRAEVCIGLNKRWHFRGSLASNEKFKLFWEI